MNRPPMMLTPHWCCVWAGERCLQWGVFPTRSQAETKANEMTAGATGAVRATITFERIWVSRRQR